ncbi:hypothetical protein [Terracoccus sp. 273MFTsu3.1]|uniref:hypothetical protein n=1 Tax=Terracoccus sp. 273MFTsu3.1 TaxID=1172188 RepID=UPI00036A6BF2|nr:hypothetical protein [Terracoccus sp. 273MFTsu3.1]
MSNLSPQQFRYEPEATKIDLGTHHLNASFDRQERTKSERAHRVGVEPAPDGYYHQPPSGLRQQALPGMEMSVQDHLDALSKASGHEARIDSGKVSHRLSLYDVSEGARYGGTEKAHLSYSNERPEEGVRDNNDTIGVGHVNAYHAGEIRMVKSHVPNGAGMMLETAERLASEHGMAYPKHSWDRSVQGVQWSQGQMRKRGEKVW